MSRRKIASHLLWSRSLGVVRHPLATFDDGRLTEVRVVEHPDSEPFTEFYAGVLLPECPTALFGDFARLDLAAHPALTSLLAHYGDTADHRPAVLSGIDYQTLCLTPHSRLEPL